jgi:hypothetical protein
MAKVIIIETNETIFTGQFLECIQFMDANGGVVADSKGIIKVLKVTAA